MTLFVLVRIYADGSRLLFGPAVPLEEALIYRRWWNYFDGVRDDAPTDSEWEKVVPRRHYKIAPVGP